MQVRVRMDESPTQFAERHLTGLAKAKLRHADWAARKCAATLMLLYPGRNVVSNTGGIMVIRTQVARYAVMPQLQDFAARKVVEILTKKGVA